MEEKTLETKLSYEQLEQIAYQLQREVLHLKELVSTTQMTAMRLKYLFDVLDRAKYFTAKFVDSCISEITDILSVREEEDIPVEAVKE